ncbi:unnamed protein product [Tilletia caries]|uniref:Uncharacterized protein n=2 Tax=Tilletia TaxID=13289 RepID=A0A8X7SUK4_9BASI|nr:hypothetical protein CF336_g6572 [Tilletia laevis]KAE8189890.1 hypothetical protein CF328_g6139 [Tilletia controversa]KAE8253646.1 hypothetical protein A4X03_0g5837 [Tilletia caries]KAE8191401.1 hypothetical protein CF335_g6099 [Tilletia laevis]KAE8243211.1 hypothetical protein A4X06_0g6474 [Tilletia controversa]
MGQLLRSVPALGFLDPSKFDEWQTLIISFDSFVLTNTGTVTLSPLMMLREKIRIIGISAVLDVPAIPHSAGAQASSSSSSSSSSTSSSTESASIPYSLLSSSTQIEPIVPRKRAAVVTGAGEEVEEVGTGEDDWASDGDRSARTTFFSCTRQQVWSLFFL